MGCSAEYLKGEGDMDNLGNAVSERWSPAAEGMFGNNVAKAKDNHKD